MVNVPSLIEYCHHDSCKIIDELLLLVYIYSILYDDNNN